MFSVTRSVENWQTVTPIAIMKIGKINPKLDMKGWNTDGQISGKILSENDPARLAA